jgi:hypothetical protein
MIFERNRCHRDHLLRRLLRGDDGRRLYRLAGEKTTRRMRSTSNDGHSKRATNIVSKTNGRRNVTVPERLRSVAAHRRPTTTTPTPTMGRSMQLTTTPLQCRPNLTKVLVVCCCGGSMADDVYRWQQLQPHCENKRENRKINVTSTRAHDTLRNTGLLCETNERTTDLSGGGGAAATVMYFAAGATPVGETRAREDDRFSS